MYYHRFLHDQSMCFELFIGQLPDGLRPND